MENRSMAAGGIVSTIGIAVTALGWSLLPSQWGAGIMGFGLAHIILGGLEMIKK